MQGQCTEAPAGGEATWRWSLYAPQRQPTPPSKAVSQRFAGPDLRTRALARPFIDEQHFTLTVQLTSGATRHHLESTYNYQGRDLSFARMYGRAAGAVIPGTMRVTELSPHTLVLVEAWQSPTTHYFIIQTFSR